MQSNVIQTDDRFTENVPDLEFTDWYSVVAITKIAKHTRTDRSRDTSDAAIDQGKLHHPVVSMYKVVTHV